MFPVCVSRSLSRRSALALGSFGMAVLLAGKRASAMMTEDDVALARHKALVQQLFDGVNAGDEDLLTALYAPVVSSTNPGLQPFLAPAGMPLPLRDFSLAAPETWATVDSLVAEGDLVAARVTWRAPHPPAGTHIAGQTMHLFRIDQDQIIAQWSAGWDWLEIPHAPTACAHVNPLRTR